jgi:hypothetical protein
MATGKDLYEFLHGLTKDELMQICYYDDELKENLQETFDEFIWGHSKEEIAEILWETYRINTQEQLETIIDEMKATLNPDVYVVGKYDRIVRAFLEKNGEALPYMIKELKTSSITLKNVDVGLSDFMMNVATFFEQILNE